MRCCREIREVRIPLEAKTERCMQQAAAGPGYSIRGQLPGHNRHCAEEKKETSKLRFQKRNSDPKNPPNPTQTFCAHFCCTIEFAEALQYYWSSSYRPKKIQLKLEANKDCAMVLANPRSQLDQ